MRASRITTILALIPTAVFWLMVANHMGGGDPSDQLIKAGVASTAICVAAPLAGCSLCLLIWERSQKRTDITSAIAFGLINLAILASLLACPE